MRLIQNWLSQVKMIYFKKEMSIIGPMVNGLMVGAVSHGP